MGISLIIVGILLSTSSASSTESVNELDQPTNTADCNSYNVGAQINSGTVAATNAAGVEITGLVPGNWYALETSDGPWYAHSYGGPPQYGAWVSNDDGDTWYRLNGNADDGHDFTTTWGTCAEIVNEHYRRGYWQATTTSIRIIVADNKFYDNSGWLGWRLYSAHPFPSH